MLSKVFLWSKSFPFFFDTPFVSIYVLSIGKIFLMKKLVENYGDKKIIITSESYEDASGKNRGLLGFMSRGGNWSLKT